MILLNVLLAGVAVVVLAALGLETAAWLPWRTMAISLACLLALAGVAAAWPTSWPGLWLGLAIAGVAGLAVVGTTWWGSADLRAALVR